MVVGWSVVGCGVVGCSGMWWLTPILVFSLSLSQAEQLKYSNRVDKVIGNSLVYRCDFLRDPLKI